MREIILKNGFADQRMSEAYKILRTNIGFSGTDKKVIFVTGCIPGEGATTVSLQLALSFSQIGKKVLLIDADLRKSEIARMLHVSEPARGLPDILKKEATASDVLYKIKGNGLDVILSGEGCPNPDELLEKKQFAEFVSDVREVYDYIIIDTPPLGSVIDAAIVAKVCDGAVLVIAARTVSRKIALSVKEQIMRSGCPILGVVFNKAD